MRKYNFVICHVCEGHGMMDNPAFSNGFTSSELNDMEPSKQIIVPMSAADAEREFMNRFNELSPE
ncbi:hypothetical protein [Brenneria tiliae]|uniref:Uncharacterized protein n=1 Tax=Brenneria tiliae TaxID=2914984 RepID=A0ABT0MSA5_9GAMM|nr:hypothetical protein [Brenneria tiliae]MCL2892502.1 hypothetical protein [Brenneria tiliae]